MNPLIARPEFVDSVSQVIGVWPAEFITEFGEPTDSPDALKLNLLWQRIEPSEEGKRAVIVPVKVNFDTGQASTPLCSHFWQRRSTYMNSNRHEKLLKDLHSSRLRDLVRHAKCPPSVRHLHRGAYPFVESLSRFVREQSDTPYSSFLGKLAQLLVDEGVIKPDSRRVQPRVAVVIAFQPGPIDGAQAHGAGFTRGV